MTVALIPHGVTTANVVIVGTGRVGAVETVVSPTAFEGMDGKTHPAGTLRWLPAGENLPPGLSPGPVTKGHAALLLLALHGHDVTAVAPNLLGTTGRKAKAA
jgi:hypothetical protein